MVCHRSVHILDEVRAIGDASYLTSSTWKRWAGCLVDVTAFITAPVSITGIMIIMATMSIMIIMATMSIIGIMGIMSTTAIRGITALVNSEPHLPTVIVNLAAGLRALKTAAPIELKTAALNDVIGEESAVKINFVEATCVVDLVAEVLTIAIHRDFTINPVAARNNAETRKRNVLETNVQRKTILTVTAQKIETTRPCYTKE